MSPGNPKRCDNKIKPLSNRSSTFIWPSLLILVRGKLVVYSQTHIRHNLAIMFQPLYGLSYMNVYVYTYLWSTHNHTHMYTPARAYTQTYMYSLLPMCLHTCTYIELSLYTTTPASIGSNIQCFPEENTLILVKYHLDVYECHLEFLNVYELQRNERQWWEWSEKYTTLILCLLLSFHKYH